MPSFAKVYATYKTFKLFFYPYGISMHDDQNILNLELTRNWNLELAQFCLQCKTSTKQFSTPYIFGVRKKKIDGMQVLMWSYLSLCRPK